MLFVSSNGWDAAGAAGYGLRTAWMNRNGLPQSALGLTARHIPPDLTGHPGPRLMPDLKSADGGTRLFYTDEGSGRLRRARRLTRERHFDVVAHLPASG